MISSEKVIATIAWNPDWLHVIELISKGLKFHSASYWSSVLTKLSKIARQFRNEIRRRLILHTDNARPHSAKSSTDFWDKLNLRIAPHPPYSPDLAPSDYFRFGYIRDNLKGLSFPSALHLDPAIKQTVQSIDRPILLTTFDQ
jgi:histone-lysine N-methyltransferase SETMAR